MAGRMSGTSFRAQRSLGSRGGHGAAGLPAASSRRGHDHRTAFDLNDAMEHCSVGQPPPGKRRCVSPASERCCWAGQGTAGLQESATASCMHGDCYGVMDSGCDENEALTMMCDDAITPCPSMAGEYET